MAALLVVEVVGVDPVAQKPLLLAMYPNTCKLMARVCLRLQYSGPLDSQDSVSKMNMFKTESPPGSRRKKHNPEPRFGSVTLGSRP